jgi:bacteriophage N4 adsorption protein B
VNHLELVGWFDDWTQWVEYLSVGLGIVDLICGLDDLILDVIFWTARLRPREISPAQLKVMDQRREKNIAVMIPAWKEDGIIRQMLLGNLSWLDYHNFHIFVGVYPNDQATVTEVKEVSRLYPNVHAILNSQAGPTSKGQILNHVVQEIFAWERKVGISFDAVLMQDAEDLMHPKVFRLLNEELEQGDFIQVPVFSLTVNQYQLVAGTYIDEFAESHTKDLLVRQHLGAAIPSAGVGTAMSRELVQGMLQQGNLFSSETLTEDYELGVRVRAQGYRARFACCYYLDPSTGEREFIATREYFPKRLAQSIRQKTRWTLGIVLQGWRNLGWTGNLNNRYFLWRDRRSVATNLIGFLGYACFFLCLVDYFVGTPDTGWMASLWNRPEVKGLFIVNITLMANRILQRTLCVTFVYGSSAAVPILLRWPVGIFINAMASARAVGQDLISSFTKVAVTWSKTEHELPQCFREANEVSLSFRAQKERVIFNNPTVIND